MKNKMFYLLLILIFTHCSRQDSNVDNRSSDIDGDGFSIEEGDCNDSDSSIFPGADETPYDGIDQDCDGSDLSDVDGDYHDALAANGDDCDDDDPAIYPGAEEVPNDGIDQNCDGIDLAIWEKIFSGSSYLSYLYSVIQVEDNGYIAIGWMAENSISHLIWLIKIDAYGNEEWRKYFEEDEVNLGTSIVPSSDGGYILLGSTGYEPHDYGPGMEDWKSDILIIKTDSNGDEKWRKIFGSEDKIEWGNDIFRTTDNHFIIVGTSGIDLWLIKIDSEGKEIWNRTYEDDEANSVIYCGSIIETNDKGYITSCRLNFHDDDYLSHSKLFVLKTDSDGNEEWRIKPFEENSGGADIIEVGNSGYAIVGWLNIDNDNQFMLMKIDKNGEEEWLQVFTPPPGDTTFEGAGGASLKRTPDDGYILVGDRYDQFLQGTFYDVWLIKTDEEGNREWDLIIDMSWYDSPNELINTNDGGYLIVGGAGYNYTWDYGLLIKTDSNGISH